MNLPANAGDTRDTSWIPGSGRSPGGGNGNPLQYSCLENLTDRGVQGATVHEVPKAQISLSMQSSTLSGQGHGLFNSLCDEHLMCAI